MSDLEQTMALDAGQVLETLNSLSSGFKAFGSTLGSMSGAFSAFNSSSGQVEKTLRGIASASNSALSAMGKLAGSKSPTAAPAAASNATALNAQLASVTASYQAAGSASQAMGNQSAVALGGAARSAGGFAVSLETISRVISTQLIVRSLNAIRGAAEDSFQGFIKLNKSAAEIQTIQGGGLAPITKQLHELSDEFNLPILDVARAKYQVLSAGFTDAADQTKILTAAFKLSKSGIGSAEEGVDLLVGSLNAYGSSADKAGEYSGKLLKGVQNGKVTISQLASTMGRVTPIASQLDVGLDEVLATMSSLTVGGVNAAIAATEVRAAMVSMLKPSNAMKDAFETLGVQGGEQLVHTFGGLHGAMQAVIKTTDGSSTALARLFPNQRALIGVMQESAQAAETFADHFAKQQKTTSKLNDQVYKIRVESDSEGVDKDINRIKNLFTTELGSKLVKGVSGIISTAGGFDSIATALRHIAPVAGAATGALVLYGTAAAACGVKNAILRNSTEGSAKAFGNVNKAVGAALLALSAYEAGKFIGAKANESIDAPRKAAEAASKKLISQRNDESDAIATASQAASDRSYQAAAAQLARTNALGSQRLAAARAVCDGLVEADKSAMEKIIGQHRAAAEREAAAARQAQDDVMSSKKNAGGLADQLSDRKFNYAGKRFGDLTKSSRDQSRALDLAGQGKKAAGHGDKEQSDALFSRAEGFAQQAASSAETTGNVVAQAHAERTIETIITTRIAAEKAFQKTRQAAGVLAAKNSAAEIAKTEKLNALAADFQKHTSGKDEEGNALTGKALVDNLAKAKQDLAAFQKLGGATVPSLLVTPKALDSLASQIQAGLKAHQFEVKLTAAHKLDTEGNAAANHSRKAAGVIEANRKLAKDSYGASKGTPEMVAGVLQHAFAAYFGRPESKAQQGQTELNAIRSAVQKQIQQPRPDPTAYNKLVDRSNSVKDLGIKELGPDTNRLAAEMDALRSVIEAQRQGDASGNLGNQMNMLAEVIDQNTEALLMAKQNASAGSSPPASTAPEPANVEEHSTGGLVGAKYLARGGPVSYFADGGFTPKGADTIPAMLSKGEFVVNAASTSRFYSQLRSINAGHAPESTGSGAAGHTFNNHFSIHGVQSPKQTGAEIAQAIARQTRRR